MRPVVSLPCCDLVKLPGSACERINLVASLAPSTEGFLPACSGPAACLSPHDPYDLYGSLWPIESHADSSRLRRVSTMCLRLGQTLNRYPVLFGLVIQDLKNIEVTSIDLVSLYRLNSFDNMYSVLMVIASCLNLLCRPCAIWPVKTLKSPMIHPAKEMQCSWFCWLGELEPDEAERYATAKLSIKLHC